MTIRDITMGDEATLVAERRNSWSNYWASGALHSCLGSFDGNYAGEVLEAWRAALAALPKDAVVLDIATGNGALPALFMAEAPAGRLARVEAVDLALVRPDWIQSLDADKRSRVNVQGGVMAETLPFPDAHFDFACSQFGIEYTDLPRSLAEAARVLKPGGTLALVLHDPESLMCRNAREELGHLDWVAQSGILGLAERMCAVVARASTPEGRQALAKDPAAEATREKLNAVMGELAQRGKASKVPDLLGFVQHTIFHAIQTSQQSGNPQSGAEGMQWLEAQLDQSRLRLSELLDCALDDAALDGFLAGTGFVEHSRRSLSFPGGDRLGWWLQAGKPA
ncbi:MAG TPA: class I SAM-dependent methyltransferase [Arenimonas sp.]|nr:class I SAM-dependent methyltransferase [Arenimonas sp.]